MMDLVDRRGRSPLTVVVVVGAHALLVIGLLRATVVRSPDVPEIPPVILFLEDSAALERSIDVARETPERAAAPLLASPTQDVATPPEARSDALRTPPAPGASPGPGAAQGGSTTRGWTDWFAIGERVARERAAREAAAARPVPAPFRAAPDKPRSPSVFAERRGRAGTSEKRADGESIFWINENCYVSTESDSLTQRELHDARRDAVQCVMRLGKREARGDLFDELPNHSREKPPDDPTLPDSRGGTGPGGSPDPLPPDPEAAAR